MNDPVRVVVADDQAIVREGLATLLGLQPGMTVVGTAGDGARALELVAEHAPDVVLMDLRMPGVDGVAATERIGEHHPDVAVVVLTTYADDESILGALRAGARGYLTKDATTAEIVRAIEAAAAGQTLLDPVVHRRLLDAASGRVASPAPSATESPLPDGLTPREAEVLRLIAQGRSNREIAATLVVSEATVKSHVNHLFSKAGVRDRAQAVRYAYEHGLTEP
ncbi:MAG: response regulator transcription factor [Patulibacter sp.]